MNKNIKFFKTELLNPTEVIKENELSHYEFYISAFYNQKGRVTHLISFHNGKSIQAIYNKEAEDSVDSIIKNYEDNNLTIPLKVWLPKQIVNNIETRIAQFYEKPPVLNYSIRYYTDLEKKKCFKEEHLNNTGEIIGGQRFNFSENGEILYAFEYNGNRQLIGCFNFITGKGCAFEDISEISFKEIYNSL